ncbi:MAG: hypothetical protein ACI8T1_002865 [Verrucomicrobiales bacterium]|jgi:hypothetical protein
MSAADSSSLRPKGITVTATASLDGVLLDCSEPVSSFSALMDRPFDTLILTLQPRLVGMKSSEPPLEKSHQLTLTHHEHIEDALTLTYLRTAE